jgi:hypothetical protein
MTEKLEIPRTKLVGMVKGKPGISFGRGVNCRITVDVPNDARNGYETYVIIITGRRKPWLIKEGAVVGAVGIIRGNTLWADSFWRH